MKLPNLRRLHIPYSIAIAVIYLIAAMAITVNPNATMRMMDSTGLTNTFYVVMLAVAAAVLFTRPNVWGFVFSLLPLVLYTIYAVIYAVSRDMPNAAVIVVYAFMISLFPLAYRICSTNGIRIHHVYGITLLPLSVAIFRSPALGTIAWIQTTYGVYSFVVAFSLGIGAVVMLITGWRRSFLAVLMMIMLFAATSALFSFINQNYVTATVNLLVFITAIYTMINTEDYFGVDHA